MALRLQPALPGPLGRAALRTAFVRSHTQGLVTRRMAAAPARPASRASAARRVSLWRRGRSVPRPLENLTFVSQCCLSSRSAECESGFFGPGCRHRCTCRPGVACDPVSGKCRTQCPPGYQGEDCGQGELLSPGGSCSWGSLY